MAHIHYSKIITLYILNIELIAFILLESILFSARCIRRKEVNQVYNVFTMCTQLYGLAISLYQSVLFCLIFGLVANQVVRDDGSFLRIEF